MDESLELTGRIDGEIREAILRLAEFPGLGHTRPDLNGVPVRFWVVYSFLIVYSRLGDGIEIGRVIHPARALAALI